MSDHICPTHRTAMTRRPSSTPEQRFAGEWFECPASNCHDVVLVVSDDLRRALQASKQTPKQITLPMAEESSGKRRKGARS